MFKEELSRVIETYGKNWTIDQSNMICTGLSRALIRGGVWEMRRTLREATDKPTANLIEKEIASKFITQADYRYLWTATVDLICTSRSARTCAKRHSVSLEDLYFIFDNLSGTDMQEVYEEACKDKWHFEPLDQVEYQKAAKALLSFSKKTARKYLSFLSKYDMGFSVEDLAQELTLVGCRVYHLKWHLPYPSSRMSLACRAIKNKAFDIIKERTDDSKARLGSYEVENPYSPHKDFERYSTTLSLDRSISDEQKGKSTALTLHQVCADLHEKNDLEHTEDLIETLCEDLDDRFDAYVKIITLEVIPQEFEEYVQQRFSKSVSTGTLKATRPRYWKNGRKPKNEDFIQTVNYRRLGKLAQEWLKLTKSDLENNIGIRLRKVIHDQGGSDVTSFDVQESVTALL